MLVGSVGIMPGESDGQVFVLQHCFFEENRGTLLINFPGKRKDDYEYG